eukprot:2687319-Pyramimonas_sp.AAC.1
MDNQVVQAMLCRLCDASYLVQAVWCKLCGASCMACMRRPRLGTGQKTHKSQAAHGVPHRARPGTDQNLCVALGKQLQSTRIARMSNCQRLPLQPSPSAHPLPLILTVRPYYMG